jgi:hypothetical protein
MQAIKIFFILTILLLPFISKAQKVPEPKYSVEKLEDGSILIEDFEDEEVGTLPKEWYNRDGDFLLETMSAEDRSLYKYKVVEENDNKFLHYDGTIVKHLNFPLRNKDVNIYETPILTWEWRALQLPKGASEKDENDTVASIYVVFDTGRVLFKKVPKSIRYTWSSTLDKGTETSKLFGNQNIIVVESGTEKAGKWVSFQRNIVEDYKRIYGDEPPKKPLAILLLSDGDSTGNISIADYDNIFLLPEK